MNVNIVCVGKIKEAYFRDAIAEYQKRLSRYCKISITELIDEKTPDKQSKALDDKVRQIEGERIINALDSKAFVVLLDISGKMLDSVELSQFIDEHTVMGINDFTFVIGGSLGVSDEVRKRADYRLSFSRMTFPHQLMRVILLEQIYRSFRISNNEPYHK